MSGRGALIPYDDVLPLFAAACPSYPTSPEAARFDDADGHFVHMAVFVEHLIRLLDAGLTEHFPEVFAVAERVLVEGDDEARSLVTAGFLRDLTSIDLYGATPTGPSDFVPWFGPEARRDPHVKPLLAPRVPPQDGTSRDDSSIPPARSNGPGDQAREQ